MTTSTTLTFQLYTGREAFPVEGATVTVTDPATGNHDYMHFSYMGE